MRLIYLVLLVILAGSTYAQTFPAGQLRKLGHFSSTDFREIRDTIMSIVGSDTTFSTAFILDGTIDRYIVSSGPTAEAPATGAHYATTIIMNATRKDARRKYDTWVSDVRSELGPSSTLEKGTFHVLGREVEWTSVSDGTITVRVSYQPAPQQRSGYNVSMFLERAGR
jgi:hypothetical protein